MLNRPGTAALEGRRSGYLRLRVSRDRARSSSWERLAPESGYRSGSIAGPTAGEPTAAAAGSRVAFGVGLPHQSMRPCRVSRRPQTPKATIGPKMATAIPAPSARCVAATMIASHNATTQAITSPIGRPFGIRHGVPFWECFPHPSDSRTSGQVVTGTRGPPRRPGATTTTGGLRRHWPSCASESGGWKYAHVLQLQMSPNLIMSVHPRAGWERSSFRGRGGVLPRGVAVDGCKVLVSGRIQPIGDGVIVPGESPLCFGRGFGHGVHAPKHCAVTWLRLPMAPASQRPAPQCARRFWPAGDHAAP